MRPARRTAGLLLIAWLAMAAPAAAQGMFLDSDRRCYAPHQPIDLTGYGFTPDGEVALIGGGLTLGYGFADYDGIFRAEMRAPALPFPLAELRLTAVDQTYRLNRASTTVRLTSVAVRVGPRDAAPGEPLRIRARGFFDGRVLYAHVRRGERVRNVRIGRLRGACRRLSVTRRLFGADARPGTYRVHFDTVRRYAPAPGRRVTYSMRVARSGATTATATATMTTSTATTTTTTEAHAPRLLEPRSRIGF